MSSKYFNNIYITNTQIYIILYIYFFQNEIGYLKFVSYLVKSHVLDFFIYTNANLERRDEIVVIFVDNYVTRDLRLQVVLSSNRYTPFHTQITVHNLPEWVIILQLFYSSSQDEREHLCVKQYS